MALLPPGVIHDGRPADGAAGFTKRVLYLQAHVMPTALIGAAVDRTNLDDSGLRAAVVQLHESLVTGEDVLDGQSRLALIAERITGHLEPGTRRRPQPERRMAHSLRSLLDEHLTTALRLNDAAVVLGRSTTHLIRNFTAEFGVSPHAYVVGRRIERPAICCSPGSPPPKSRPAPGSATSPT